MADDPKTAVDPNTPVIPAPGALAGGQPSNTVDPLVRQASYMAARVVSGSELVLQEVLERLDKIESLLGKTAQEAVFAGEADLKAVVDALAQRLIAAERALASLGAATITGTHSSIAADGKHFVSWLQKFSAWLNSAAD